MIRVIKDDKTRSAAQSPKGRTLGLLWGPVGLWRKSQAVVFKRNHQETLMRVVLAVPSEAPGGANAEVSAHFGHCKAFSIFEIEGSRVIGRSPLFVQPHEHGNCLAPVLVLANVGVTALAARGMGARPLMGFLESGIQPYFTNGNELVGDVVAAFVEGTLPRFTTDQTCHHHGDEDCQH